jgi:hypothetical protein
MTDTHSTTLSTKDTARFWAKVDRSGDPDACWLWTAYRDPCGYGRLLVNRRSATAHRLAWVLAYGTIPIGMCVLHRCDVPACVRPEHRHPISEYC